MKIKKILSFFLAVLFCFSLLIPSAFAAEKSAIEQELENVISFADYPANSSDTGVYLITLMEDGYNGTGYDSSSGIYVYLYNPSKKAFNSSSDLNKMTFAKNFQLDGSPCDLEKYFLTLIESAKDGVLIKAKVKAAASELVIKSSGVRHYVVSEIELFEDGHYNTNAQAYKCGYDFAFTGSGEDLKCERTSFLTIDLDVKSTSYITGDSAKGINYSNLLYSVYFSVPEAIEAKYGKLNSIKYEAEKYYTSPMILVEKKNASVLKALEENLGVSSKNTLLKFRFGDGDGDLTFDYGFGYVDGEDLAYGEGVNYSTYYTNEMPIYTTFFGVDTLAPNTLVVSSEEILTYFLKYSEGRRNLIHGVYSVNLFKSSDGQKVGDTIDRNQWGTLPSYADSHEWYEGVADYGLGYLWNKDKHDDTVNAKMIQLLDPSDFGSLSFCDDFYVSEMDVEDLEKYVSAATTKHENTYLFRFAFEDDYYAAEGGLRLYSENGYSYYAAADINGVVMPVYLNFDIFQLGFSDDGKEETVFGVVSSPTNIFADASTSDKNIDGLPDLPDIDCNWLKFLIALFAGLFAFYIFINVANWFLPSKKKNEEKIIIQMPEQSQPLTRSYSNRKYSKGRYRRGRRR